LLPSWVLPTFQTPGRPLSQQHWKFSPTYHSRPNNEHSPVTSNDFLREPTHWKNCSSCWQRAGNLDY
jgi:hypothetical protein